MSDKQRLAMIRERTAEVLNLLPEADMPPWHRRQVEYAMLRARQAIDMITREDTKATT